MPTQIRRLTGLKLFLWAIHTFVDDPTAETLEAAKRA